ncbi:hypothetical protein [Flavobacterium sp.]|uniref:hypothetical protein n=1 Tax=Flavobacterium sp. TaxID=239 RepID=UPI00374D599F
MEKFDEILKIIDLNLITSLVPLLFAIILIESIFKNRFKTKQVLNLVRWIIISYTIVSIIHYLIRIIVFSEESAFLNRATGPYWWAYWLMFISATILPLTLFYKKLMAKAFYLLFIAIFINIGMYFERFVIIVTSFHRDYSTDNELFDLSVYLIIGYLMLILQGFILAIILLGIFELIERRKQIKEV